MNDSMVSPVAVKKAREAMKRVNDVDLSAEYVRGDHVEVRSYPGGKHERMLIIFKDGQAVAGVPIVNSTFKRLKKEWLYWNDLQSGLMTAYRQHGSRSNGIV